MQDGWLDRARETDLLAAATRLGLTVWRDREIRPCPSCGVGKPGSAKVHASEASPLRWYCFRCDEGGDVIDLVAFVLCGTRLPNKDPRWRDLRSWFAADAVAPATSVVRPSHPASRTPTRRYPPDADIQATWGGAGSVLDDAEARAWLHDRGLDPERVRRAGIARVLPPSWQPTSWAWFRGDMPRKRSWPDLGYRLLLPLYDAEGLLRSLRARRMGPNRTGADDPPKAVPPAGFSAGGLVMADPGGRDLLMDGPDSTPCQVVIAEGEPQFLAWACSHVDANVAVFGVVAGAWTPEVAARVPDRSEIILATDADRSGDRFAEVVASSLRQRCRVSRWTPRPPSFR